MNTELFIIKSKLSHNEFTNTILLALNYFYKNSSDTTFFDKKDLFFLLTGRLPKIRENKKDRLILNGIHTGLDLLIQKKQIHIIFQDKDFFEISTKELYINCAACFFVKTNRSHIQKIFNHCSKPFAMASVYLQILSKINQKTHAFYMPQSDLANELQIAPNTLYSYLNQLQELKLIYVHIGNGYQIDHTKIKSIVSFYGAYCHKEQVIEQSQKYMDGFHTYHQYKNINRRSIKLRYISFLKGAKKYEDMDQIQHLYQDCIAYNHSYQSSETSDPYIQNKLLDLLPLENRIKYYEHKGV